MKKVTSLAKFSFIALALAFVSCNKDDDSVAEPVNNTPDSASYITGKVDGADFSSIIFGTSTAQCSRIGTGSEQLITILAGDMSANSIVVTLAGVSNTGEIAVNKNTDSFLNYSPGTGGVAYATSADCDNATGTINVTHIDGTKVEGTFSFTGVNTDNCGGGSKTVTEGSFRGTYQQ